MFISCFFGVQSKLLFFIYGNFRAENAQIFPSCALISRFLSQNLLQHLRRTHSSDSRKMNGIIAQYPLHNSPALLAAEPHTAGICIRHSAQQTGHTAFAATEHVAMAWLQIGICPCTHIKSLAFGKAADIRRYPDKGRKRGEEHDWEIWPRPAQLGIQSRRRNESAT